MTFLKEYSSSELILKMRQVARSRKDPHISKDHKLICEGDDTLDHFTWGSELDRDYQRLLNQRLKEV